MTKHFRKIEAADTPPTDGAEAIEPKFPHGINPAWDVAQIATDGHVLTARVRRAVKLAFYPVLALGVVAGYYTFKASYSEPTPFFPQSIVEALTYNENTYFDLGGGLRGPASFAWLGNYAPTPESLSQADYDALVSALQSDLSAHGTKMEDWTAVEALKIAPKITSPARLLTEFKDRLKDGAVVVDKDNGALSVVAYVGGTWAVTSFRPRGCSTLLGPLAKGCDDLVTKQGLGSAVTILDTIKPASKG